MQSRQHRELEIGTLLLQNGFSEEALKYLQGADRSDIRTKINLGVCYRHLGRFTEALDILMTTLGQQRQPAALTAIGSVSEDLGNYKAATTWHEEAHRLMPTNEAIALNYSLCLLREGRLQEAWPLYDFGRSVNNSRYPPLPRWNINGSDDTHGKRILVCPEGGYGDTLLYMRYLEELKSLGFAITLMTWDSMIPLLKLELKNVVNAIVPESEELPLFGEDNQPLYDFCLPLMSLPAALDYETSQALASPKQTISASPRPLDTRSTKRIGLCWTAGEDNIVRKHRSLTREDALTLTKATNAEWVSLVPNQELTVGSAAPLTANSNWLDTKRVIDNCDLVISVDTAVAHLAGAMGKPTWILLPLRRDWKWGLPEQPFHWYKYAQYFQQTNPTSWGSVLKEISTTLRQEAVSA